MNADALIFLLLFTELQDILQANFNYKTNHTLSKIVCSEILKLSQ